MAIDPLLILKNLSRKRQRTALTMASIATSLCLISLLFAIWRSLFLTDITPAQALRLVVHHGITLVRPLPISYEQKIARLPGVKAITVWQWFGGTYKDARDRSNFFARFAVEPQAFLAVHPELGLPEEEKHAFIADRSGCIVSSGLGQRFGWNLGDRITIIGDSFPVTLEFTVRGIFDDPDGIDALYFNLDYLRESLPATDVRRDATVFFQVLAEDTAAAAGLPEAVDSLFENATEPTKTESDRAFQLSYASFVGNLKLYLLSIFGAVTFSILMVSANTMAMSARERIREVGILKTLGFPTSWILSTILGEAAFISVCGGIAGVLLAQLLARLIREGPAAGTLNALAVTPGVAALTVFIALVIGLVSSWIPAWKASRTPILEALRHSG